MHILFTIANDSYVPYFNWFARQALNYPEIRFSFLCMFRERPRMIDDMKSYSCPVYWILYDDTKRKRHMLKAIPEVFSLIMRIQPDVVHSHLFDDALVSLTAARLAGVPVRAITKGDACYHYFYTPQWMIFDKLNNLLATHIVSLSGENKKFILEKEKANPGKLTIIHHGIPKQDYLNIDQTKVAAFKKRYKLENKMVFGSVGRLEPNKGFVELINTAVQIKERCPEFIILIAGEGALKDDLANLIIESGLGNQVKLVGWIDEADIPNLYECMDVYVHNSHFETFGFVIAEAMMHGLPVVATNSSGAAKDVIEHKKNGYLFDYGDNEELLNGMTYFIDNKDEIQKEQNAEIALEKFEFDVMWSNHISLYENAINSH